jgi:PAS domain S-box-containing protein
VEGTTSWVRIEGIPQRQADGSSLWQGVMSDITEPKRRELDLQRSLDHAPIAIVALALTDPDPEITYVNQAFRRTFGYDRSAIPRRSDWIRLSFPDPAYREALLTAWQTELESINKAENLPVNQELTVCTADGRSLDVLVNWVVLDGVLLVSLLDITELRQTERDLLQARSALAETALAITEAIPVGTYTMVLPPDAAGASTASVGAEARPGIQVVRFVNSEGATLPVRFALGPLPLVEEKEPNDEVSAPQAVAKLPAWIQGRLEKGGDVDGYAFEFAGVWVTGGEDGVAVVDGDAEGSGGGEFGGGGRGGGV